MGDTCAENTLVVVRCLEKRATLVKYCLHGALHGALHGTLRAPCDRCLRVRLLVKRPVVSGHVKVLLKVARDKIKNQDTRARSLCANDDACMDACPR